MDDLKVSDTDGTVLDPSDLLNVEPRNDTLKSVEYKV